MNNQNKRDEKNSSRLFWYMLQIQGCIKMFVGTYLFAF